MTPVTTTSALYPIRLRADLPRHVARAYWSGPHAEIVTRLPHMIEYNQHHFSATDHGFWPATPKVGTITPSCSAVHAFAVDRTVPVIRVSWTVT